MDKATLILWGRYLVIAIFTYLGSITLKHILDKKVTKLRIDNYLLYLILAKTPYASTKITMRSKKRLQLDKIKNQIEKNFELDRNENIRNNSFIFKIRNHPTPMKIMVIEPDKEQLFTVTIETFGDDKIPKIFRGSFPNTINYLEKISKELEEFELKTINASVKISCYLDGDDKITYSPNNKATLSNKTISVNSKEFTDIEPMIKECLAVWRNKFI